MKTPRPLRTFGSVLKWIGLTAVATGGSGTVIAMITAVRTQTGWGLSDFERCCRTDELNTAALALLLGSMFFVVAGSGLILISRPLLPQRSVGSSRPWRWLARSLFVYSACSLAVGIILLGELRDVATVAAVGIFSYCVLVAVGLLLASWGLKRFAEAG